MESWTGPGERGGHVSANNRPHHWGDRKMRIAMSSTECSQVAGLIQKVGRSSSKAPSLRFFFFFFNIHVPYITYIWVANIVVSKANLSRQQYQTSNLTHRSSLICCSILIWRGKAWETHIGLIQKEGWEWWLAPPSCVCVVFNISSSKH